MKNKSIKIVTIIILMSMLTLSTIAKSYAQNTTEQNTTTSQENNTQTGEKTGSNEDSGETQENSNNEETVTSTQKATTTTNQKSTVATNQKSSNANLKNLGIKPHDFSGFTPTKTEYNVTVPEDTTSVEVYAQTQDSKAKVSGTGVKTLQSEETSVDVLVTAEDGTTKTYTINIIKGELDQNSDEENNTEVTNSVEGLSNLTINDLKLSPDFQTNIYEYTVKYIGEDSKLEIKAEPTGEDYIVEIVGNNDLKEGENIVTILVSKSNGDNVATYQITVNKSLVDEEAIAREEAERKEKQKMIIIGSAIGLVLVSIIIVFITKRRKNTDYDNEYSEVSLYGMDEDDNNYEDEYSNIDKSLDEEDKLEEQQEYEEMQKVLSGKHENIEDYENIPKEQARKTFLNEYNSDNLDKEVRRKRNKGKRFK